MKNLILATSLLLIFLGSCKKEKDDFEIASTPGSISFSLNIFDEQSGSNKSTETDMTNASSIVIEIVNSSDSIIYSNKKINLLNFNGELISEPLSLSPGNYKLTKFFVLDSSNSVIYACPAQNSELSYLVDFKLPFAFSIGSEQITKISPDVIRINNYTPEEFGYTTYDFNIIDIFDFFTTVFIYDSLQENLVFTSAKIEIKYNDEVVYSGDLKEGTNRITLVENQGAYNLTISKPGFVIFSSSYALDSIKSFYSRPLTVVLKELRSEMTSYYPFNGDAKDYSGNGQDGSEYGEINYTGGLGGYSKLFDGNEENFEYVIAPASINTEQYTVCFWTNLKDLSNLNYSFIMLNATNSWAESEFWVFVSYSRIAVLQNGQDLRKEGYYSHFPVSDSYMQLPELSTNVDYYISVTFKNGTVSIYLNGEVYSSYDNVNSFDILNSGLLMGTCPNPNTGSYAYQLKGTLDEVKIFNRCFSQQEIQELYNN